MSRCVDKFEGEGKDHEQAVAICASMWSDKSANGTMLRTVKLRAGQQFGYGITTADRQLPEALDEVGRGAAAKYRVLGRRGAADHARNPRWSICGRETETIGEPHWHQRHRGDHRDEGPEHAICGHYQSG
jgi:hypothetical protein